jgi:hypothetical protein
MLFDQFLGVLRTHIGNLSKSSQLDTRIANQFMGMTPAHFTRPNNRDIYPVVRGLIPLGCPDMGR